MLIIKPRYKRGSGILDIFKNVTKAGVKDAIKKAASSATAHKIADGVVEGTASGTKRLIHKKLSDLSSPRKKIRLDISQLKSGAGIVLD